MLILSYLETEFVLTTHVKALDLKGFAALTSTSEAREVKDFLSMRGRSREAALLKVISCVPVPLGTCSCLQPFPVCLLSIWRKPAALRDTGLIGQPTSILSNSSTFDPASHMLLLRPAVFSLLWQKLKWFIWPFSPGRGLSAWNSVHFFTFWQQVFHTSQKSYAFVNSFAFFFLVVRVGITFSYFLHLK